MASGDFLDLATRACYQSRFRPANSDDLARAKEAVNECYTSMMATGERWQFLERETRFTIDDSADVYSLDSIGAASGTSVIEEIYQFVNDTSGGAVLESLDWLSLEN